MTRRERPGGNRANHHQTQPQPNTSSAVSAADDAKSVSPDTWVIATDVTENGAVKTAYWNGRAWERHWALSLDDPALLRWPTKDAAVDAVRRQFERMPRSYRAVLLTAEQVALLTPPGGNGKPVPAKVAAALAKAREKPAPATTTRH